jgi:hypothetical protein
MSMLLYYQDYQVITEYKLTIATTEYYFQGVRVLGC